MARPSTLRAMACAEPSAFASSVQSSIGIETNAGPLGGSEAVWIARPMAAGTSAAVGGSYDHLTRG